MPRNVSLEFCLAAIADSGARDAAGGNHGSAGGAIPATATVLEACEFFVLYKFFAFPVVDAERRVVGVVE